MLVQLGAMMLIGFAADDGDVKVMSFNIRYATGKDGENHWDKRKDFLADTIKAFDPDVLGTQETLVSNATSWPGSCPVSASSASAATLARKGRDDGLVLEEGPLREAGRRAFLAQRAARCPWHQKSGHLAPAHGYMGEVEGQAEAGCETVLFMNTHFDHMGKKARLESAKLIRERIISLGRNAP